jgi:hypothetical protein
MNDQTLYPETIPDNEISVGGSQEISLNINESSGNDLKTTTIEDQSLPTKKIAVELLSSALNTRSKKILQEFEFTESGALAIGKFLAGVNGDIKISPTGIVARDSSGLTSFALDGETGSATFRGTIQGTTVIAEDVVVGDNSIRLDGTNRRIIIYDDDGMPFLVMGEY